jgi:UDP-N-acetylglucosamine transferase subunit ALG13
VILVTVGSMMAFDRLITATDRWANAHPDHDVYAQIGAGTFIPRHMRWTRMIPPIAFKQEVINSTLIIAHAGMGSYLVAMEARRPIVLFPRLADKSEHTTDHQLHTVKWLGEKPGVFVAMFDDQLDAAIDLALRGTKNFENFNRFAPESFTTKIREFIVS